MAPTNEDELSKLAGSISIFDEQRTAERTNIFSYQSAWGTSVLRDVITGAGAVSLNNGLLQHDTGATSGQKVRNETVDFGRYMPGKSAEAGIGFILDDEITGDAKAKAGLGNGANGGFLEITEDDVKCVVLRGGSREAEVSQSDWNVDSMDGSGPSGLDLKLNAPDSTRLGYLIIVEFVWYGIGPVIFKLATSDPDTNKYLDKQIIHVHRPDRGRSFIDPNIPVFSEVSNGTQSKSFKASVGGRRYDVIGDFSPEYRTVGGKRDGQSVPGDGTITPLVSVKRKETYPNNRDNTVPAFLDAFDITSDQDAYVWVLSGGDLTTSGSASSFSSFPQVDTDETALEFNQDADTISSYNHIQGPFRVTSTSNNKPSLSKESEFRSSLNRNEPMTLAMENVTGQSATVSTSLRCQEEQ